MKWILYGGIAVVLYILYRIVHSIRIFRLMRAQEKMFAGVIPFSPSDRGVEVHFCPDSAYYGTYFVTLPGTPYCLEKMHLKGMGQLYLFHNAIGFRHHLELYPFYIPMDSIYQVQRRKFLWMPILVVFWKKGRYQLRSTFRARKKTVDECFEHIHRRLRLRGMKV